MHDLKLIRDDPKGFAKGLKRRGLDLPPQITETDEALRKVQAHLQELQARRNELSREIGALKAKGEDAAKAMKEVASLKEKVQRGEDEERDLKERREALIAELPNLPHESVPDGASEKDNQVVREGGKKPAFAFKPREHFDLGEALGQMDFEAAARVAGARFVVLKGALARLERAIGQFMLDLATQEHGYTEASVPSLVRSGTLYGTGQLPKFAGDLFRTSSGYWLIPTAEVPLVNLERETIVEEERLPLRLAALTPCYRAEAGAAGKDTRGMIRVHEFQKVELVSVTTPEASLEELERKLGAAEEVVKRLGLPYRVVELCTADLSFASRKTYDIEVWLPGQGAYREVSSVSDCGEFQARRMNLRCRKKGEKGTRFPHTLNGSGVAVGRCLVAVMENFQEADGSIRVPEALSPYVGGLAKIARG
ncbi:MAG TPA: serine--tRNA ligase [Sphingomonadales bacterium]|nr:serine--tRNA ligase [Sphingomonadales bacterium]